MPETRSNPRVALVCALALAALAVTIVRPPIHQWRDYHALADSRGAAGIPNLLNVASNLPFLVVGFLGLRLLSRPSPAFRKSWERGPYAILMGSFVLVFFGSSIYHWNPSDRTLFWDRIPLSLVFSSILGVTIIERMNPKWGARLFLPLVVAGVTSVIYWHLGNAQGHGDLRYYVLLQGGAILSVPLLMFLFPPRYTGGRELLAIVALYGAAKIFETYDAEVYRAGHLVSGHTIKHLLGALAAWQFVAMLRRRRPVETPAPAESLVAPAPQA